jgi:hypothetical protein
MGLDYFSSIQTAIGALLAASVPAFLIFGTSMFRALALIRIGWEGVETAWSSAPSDERMFSFVKLLLHLSFAYAIVTFYTTPIPGLGISFVHLITDQMAYFCSLLDATTVSKSFDHWNQMGTRFIQPSVLDVGANVLYVVFQLVLIAAKGLSFIVVSFGMIATAALTVVGPVFIPFLIAPGLEWLFWGWFKAFLQYAFLPVMAYVYLMIFEQYIFNVLTDLPAGVTADLYGTYGFQVITVGVSFCLGLLYIPKLNADLFSGSGGASTGASVINYVRNKF